MGRGTCAGQLGATKPTGPDWPGRPRQAALGTARAPPKLLPHVQTSKYFQCPPLPTPTRYPSSPHHRLLTFKPLTKGDLSFPVHALGAACVVLLGCTVRCGQTTVLGSDHIVAAHELNSSRCRSFLVLTCKRTAPGKKLYTWSGRGPLSCHLVGYQPGDPLVPTCCQRKPEGCRSRTDQPATTYSQQAPGITLVYACTS